MRLVLDTNVLIAAFIAKGVCHTLVERCLLVHAVITSEFIFDELREKLFRKFKFSQEDVIAVETLLRSRAQVVTPVPLASNVCRDPDDDMVLATAIAGEAVCIVTGDKDLLSLKKFEEVQIISPSAFETYEEEFNCGKE